MAKQGKTISKHDVIRAVTSLNMSLNNIVRRIELIEKNLGDYIEMKKDVGDLVLPFYTCIFKIVVGSLNFS